MIMGLSAIITSMPSMGPYYYAKPCDLLATFFNSANALEAKYPVCKSAGAWAAIKADLSGGDELTSASLNMTFGMALWLALALHAIGIEFYVRCDVTLRLSECCLLTKTTAAAYACRV